MWNFSNGPMTVCVLSKILQINFTEEYGDHVEAVIVISITYKYDPAGFNDSRKSA